jgi:formate-dependent phosphoribosylglycinamide formyltransferase (GAR transformylase)
MDKDETYIITKHSTIIDLVQQKPVTFIRIRFDAPYGGMHIFGVGLAVCNDSDVWNDGLGRRIAFGRAVKHISKQLDQFEANARLRRGREMP